jgi:hypothetical protein
MEQITRCDIHPEGWESNNQGTNGEDVSTWTCTNTTVSRISELPQFCQFGTFWDIPSNAMYQGTESVGGYSCDWWTYQFDDPNNNSTYAFWAQAGTAIPVATAELTGTGSGYVFMSYFNNFDASTPAESAFEPVKGSDCPASTAPSEDQLERIHHQARGLLKPVTSLSDYSLQASFRSRMNDGRRSLRMMN